MKNNIIIGSIVIFGILGFLFLQQRGGQNTLLTQDRSSSSKLTPVNEITHGHGLAVDVSDPKKLYIATHHGLLALINEKDLYRVGESNDDYMGFSPHPTNAKVFFSSGHPATGGNIGFQKSEDGGFTWQKVSDGVGGPVDFHAMVVSPVTPNLLFGWYHGAVQRSTDGGKNWEIVTNTNFPIISLAANPKNENILYAASPLGLFVSSNKGRSFDSFLDGFVSVVTVNPSNSEVLSFSEKIGLARSDDNGKTWIAIHETFAGETPLHIAFAWQNPNTVYLLTEKNSIYKSTDSGGTWRKIR